MKPNELRSIRDKISMNQRTFGIILGLSPTTAQSVVSALECGRRPISNQIMVAALYIDRYGPKLSLDVFQKSLRK